MSSKIKEMEAQRKIYVYGSVIIDDDILNSSLQLTNFLKDTKLIFMFLTVQKHKNLMFFYTYHTIKMFLYNLNLCGAYIWWSFLIKLPLSVL